MLLKIVPVKIVSPSKTIDTYAFLDDGSTISIISKKLAQKIGLAGTKVKISVVGIKGDKFELVNCQKLDFNIETRSGSQMVKGAVTSDNVKLPTQTISSEFISTLNLPDFVDVQPYYNAQVGVLIGQDNWQLIAARETIAVGDGNVAVSCCLLGWAVHGPARITPLTSSPVHSTLTDTHPLENSYTDKIEDEKIDELIKHFFELESIGVNLSDNVKSKHERSSKILHETSRFLGSRWETGLLWKSDRAPDVDSYPMALKRLHLLERKLDRDPEFADLYYAEMQRFIDKGYAKKVEKGSIYNRVWYIPHFGVTNVNKPGKVRLVFDSAAKVKGISLSDQLDAGPDLLQNLAGVLIRFRQYAVAMKGDISDMFLRIQMREEDRGAQRFLWRGKLREGAPDELEMTTLIFGNPPPPVVQFT